MISDRISPFASLVSIFTPLIQYSAVYSKGARPGTPVYGPTLEGVVAADAVGGDFLVGCGIAKVAVLGAQCAPFVADGSLDAVGADAGRPVDRAALVFLTAVDAVGEDDLVGGGVLEESGFVALLAPFGEELVGDGVGVGVRGPVDVAADELRAFAGVAGVGELVGLGEQEEPWGSPEKVDTDSLIADLSVT